MAMNQADTNKLEQKLEQKQNGAAAPANTKKDAAKLVQDKLTAMLPELKKALPRHITAERLARITLTACRLTPKLMDIAIQNPPSFFGAVMQAAQLGLEPNLLGSCYLIPYGNVVQFQIGYQGMLTLANRSGELSTISVETVFKNDEFRYTLGTKREIHHIPAEGDRGEIRFFYAVAEMKNGSNSFKVMSAEDINKIRDKHAGRGRDGNVNKIWVEHYEAMAHKTVIKRLLKLLPISVELKEMMEMDGRTIIDLEKSEYTVTDDEQFSDVEFAEELI